MNGRILLNAEGSTDLEKYTFSNAMALSVKLASWEASLDRYVDSIEFVVDASSFPNLTPILSRTRTVVVALFYAIENHGNE